MSNTPKIRFSGFTEDWEQRKVSEIAIEKLSNGIVNNQVNDETGLRHINVINMYDSDKIHPEKLTFSGYDEDAVKKCNVELGDIFLTRSSLKPEGIAEANVLLDSGRFVYDDHLIRLKVDKENYNPFFVKLNLSEKTFKRQFIVRAKTTAFTTIGQEDIAECSGLFPKREEQEKIGIYFSHLDHLITLHQRKYDDTKLLKKYMLQKMFPQNGQKVPEIRFSGFTGDWEQRKLEDFGKATGGTSIESEFSEDGIYKVVSIGSYSENSVYNDQGIRAIKSDKTSNRVLNRNDLTMILNDKTTSGNIIGRVLLIEESGIYVYNQRTERIEINLDEYDPVFLYEMLNAPNIREKIIKQAQGNTQIYVNWTAISLLEYMIPSKEEQVKIGEYLHNISNLITLHQRKYDDTKLLKKYMLQKMFPQNVQKVPEIRFSGFTGDWEQRKLGELGEIMTGSTPSTSKSEYYSEEGIPWVTPTDINALTISDTPKKLSEKGMKVGRVVPANTILCTCIASIGKNALLTVKGSFNQQINSLTPSAENDSYFLLTESELWSEKMKRMAASGTMQIVNKTEFSELDTMVPSLDEQKIIGLYFRNLDHLITLHQRKCDELKELKKYMLQNMFPQKG